MAMASKEHALHLVEVCTVRCIQDEAEDRRAGSQQVIVQGRLHCQQHRCVDEPGCVFGESQVGVIAGWKLLNLARGCRR